MKLTASGGVVLFGLATVAFIVLKLTHAISWSWLWVLSPALVHHFRYRSEKALRLCFRTQSTCQKV